MSVALGKFQSEGSTLNDVDFQNMVSMLDGISATLEVSHFERCNMLDCILVALEMSRFERSMLKSVVALEMI